MSRSAPMAQPPDPLRSYPQASAEESYLELLTETMETLDRPVRAQFIQRFIKAMAQVDLSEQLAMEYWDQILARKHELSESLGKPVALKTAMVDVLSATNHLRMPILMEYEELKKLQINAATDALTGLYNRRLFDEYFTKELNRSKRYGQHLALIMMDLHKFKEVNDRFGHLQGDQVLQIAATTLRRTLRTSDYAFRIGGDEFALLLPQSDPEQATILAKRLRASYEAAIQPLKIDAPLAIDFGVAVFPEDGDAKESLVKLADDRLYQLKNSMRGQPRLVSVDVPSREAMATVGPAIPTIPAVPLVEPPRVAAAAAAAAAGIAPSAKSGADKRKWERVSMVGTRAYAVLGDNPEQTARVIDLSYGGVALQVESAEDTPANFSAVLHVPILPPVKVNLRKTNVQHTADNRIRIGCAFVS